MTSYSAMSARGREESRARTVGRRKSRGVRIEYDEPDRSNVTPLPRSVLPPYRSVRGRLIGECGHTLRWLAAVPVGADGEPRPPRYLTEKIGRLVTCDHADCRIPEHVPSEADCEYIVGVEVERRCTTRARWDTEMGKVCTKHRNHYLREGYIDGPGDAIPKG